MSDIKDDDDDNITRDMRNNSMTAPPSYIGNNEITEAGSGSSSGRVWELTPISEGEINTMQTTSLFSIDINNFRSSGANNVVYVAVGDSPSSSDALCWALSNAPIPGATLVYLVHIFSEIKLIPSPLGGGWVPKSQVSRELVESYAAKQSNKRRQLLSKYVDICTTYLAQVETILIESDSVANAIVELISVLNIPKLVVGISKSNLRKMTAGKTNGGIVAHQLLQKEPVGCEVKIICQGKDVMSSDQSLTPFTANGKSVSPTAAESRSGVPQGNEQPPPNVSPFSCCFRPSPNHD